MTRETIKRRLGMTLITLGFSLAFTPAAAGEPRSEEKIPKTVRNLVSSPDAATISAGAYWPYR